MEKKVKIKSTGQDILVYQSRTKKDVWINSSDCKTEYHKDELQFFN